MSKQSEVKAVAHFMERKAELEVDLHRVGEKVEELAQLVEGDEIDTESFADAYQSMVTIEQIGTSWRGYFARLASHDR